MKKSQLKALIKEIISEMVATPLQYKFKEFGWMGNMSGFGVPIDVSYGSTYLGTVESQPDGYSILIVDTPQGRVKVEKGPKNKFKSKNLAAESLHKLWKWARK